MSDYFNVTTNVGDAAIATAIANNSKLNITHIAFGDGNGSVPTPTKTRTSLVREVHRQAVTKYTMHPTIANYIVIETIIPSNIGGFWIREMGIIADNVLISHGSHAPFFKVADPDGVSEYRLKFTQNVRDGNVVEISLDESLIYASQAWVNENYIRRNEIVDNLTSNDANKPISARQAKILQESKVQLDNSPTSQGPYVSWNKSEGQGETDFINNRGFGSGGFNFYNGDNNNFNLIAYIDGSGVFTPLNGVNGNASTATKLKNARDISFSGAATGSFNFDGSANASCILTLANSGVVASTYGSTLKIPVITVNAKGLITGVSEQNIPIVDDLTTDDGNKPLSARQGKKLQDEKFPLTGGTLNGSMKAIAVSAAGMTDYSPTEQGAYLSWNRAIGLGKTDFINHKGGGGGGFDWWNGNQDNYTRVMTLNSDGSLDVSGGLNSNAATATKLKTPRTIFGQTFDGSNDVGGTITASTGLVQSDNFHYIDMGRVTVDRMNFYNYGATFNFIDSQNGNVVARLTQTGIDCNSASASKVINVGDSAAYEGVGANPPYGLTLASVYQNGYPTPFGNVLRLGGQGQGEILVGWPGDDGLAPSFIRSKRDGGLNNWTLWREIVFVDSLPSHNVGSASKLKTPRNIALAGAVSGNANFDGSGNVEIITVPNTNELRVVEGSGYTITYDDYRRIAIIQLTLWTNQSITGQTIAESHATNRYQVYSLPITLKKRLSVDIQLSEEGTTTSYFGEAGEWLRYAMQDGYRGYDAKTKLFVWFKRWSGSDDQPISANATIVGIF
ncbi:phage tail protein [Acinetobacter johnsonii]|uniref:phage tail protein n=1 Tax=Acinetobacter johnsonii TaxID=40214 RepID=UPI003AF5F8E1